MNCISDICGVGWSSGLSDGGGGGRTPRGRRRQNDSRIDRRERISCSCNVVVANDVALEIAAGSDGDDGSCRGNVRIATMGLCAAAAAALLRAAAVAASADDCGGCRRITIVIVVFASAKATGALGAREPRRRPPQVACRHSHRLTWRMPLL